MKYVTELAMRVLLDHRSQINWNPFRNSHCLKFESADRQWSEPTTHKDYDPLATQD